ncbi:MAG TPA: ModE family transcriptional regulator [Burkholderiaceae bacterium]|nr:ModE family transcriptional regulator [Burkholderiaceae bacterium]
MTRPAPRLSIRIVLGADKLGPGKVALLEEIGRLRSLAAAARALGMSYKRAWELLAMLNAMFEYPVAIAHPGRNLDGSTELTQFGERVIALYRAVERRAAGAASAGLDELGAAARSGAGGATRARRSPASAPKRAVRPVHVQAPARLRRARPT